MSCRIASCAELAWCIVALSCAQATGPEAVTIRIVETSARDLPAVDPSRLYKYRFARVAADSLLHVLLRERIPVSEARLPLEDLCMDPVGPRFTLVLLTPDDRLEGFSFDPGNGIRACTSRVRRYIVLR